MTREERVIAELVEVVEAAIKDGDWVVDGACDPSLTLDRANSLLCERGYSRDGITGETFVEAL